MKSPTLSIMLPTYNRSDKLSRLLALLKETCSEEFRSNSIDFCIIDNSSTDATPRVIDSFEGDLKIRKIRNDENIGGNNNVLKCMLESRGEFTWIVGDDDIILPGSIRAIFEALRKSPNSDFVGVPLGLIEEKDLSDAFHRGSIYEDGILKHVRFAEKDLPKFLRAAEKRDYQLDWADLIDPDFNSVFLGAVTSSVFRTAPCAREAQGAIMNLDREPFDALDNTYPHSMIFAKCFAGKQACVLPKIALAAIVWERAWGHYRSLLVTKRLNDLLDYYSGLGVEPSRIERCRRSLLLQYQGVFWEIVFERDPLYRKDFSLFRQVREYWRYREFWVGIRPDIKRLLRRVYRKIVPRR